MVVIIAVTISGIIAHMEDPLNVGAEILFPIFLFNAVYEAIQAIISRDSKPVMIRHTVNGILFLAGTVLPSVFERQSDMIVAAASVYAATLITSRISSMIVKPKPLNMILNILGIVTAVLLIGITNLDPSSFEQSDISSDIRIVIFGMFIICQCLVHIIQISFSKIKYDMLLKILRRSMAFEIRNVVCVFYTFRVFLYAGKAQPEGKHHR